MVFDDSARQLSLSSGDPLALVGGDWSPIASTAGPRWRDGFTVRSLARSGRRRLFLCEADTGAGMPGSELRHAWRAAMASVYGEYVVVVIADASHSTFVWSWRLDDPSSGDRWVEYRVPPREAALRHALRTIDDPEPPLAATGPDAEWIVGGVVRPFTRSPAPPPADLDGLITWIERSGPESLRSLWRSLARLAVLDPQCGDGWLLAEASVLEPIYLACIDRMRGIVDEPSHARRPRRPEFLRDLKSIVDLADDHQRHPSPRLFVRRAILQRNLYGVDRSRPAVRSCLRRALAHAGLAPGGIGILDTNLRYIPVPLPLSSPSGASGPSWACDRARIGLRRPSTPDEDLCILGRTLELLRDRRLKRDDTDQALRRASLQLERRRRQLARRAGGGAEDVGGGWPSGGLALAFPSIPRAGGVLLVRDVL